MAGYKKRRAIKGQRTRRVNCSIDSITDAATQVKARRDGTSFSAALCQLAMTAVINDPELMDAIKLEAIEVIKSSLIETGYTVEEAHALADSQASPEGK